MGSLAQSRVQNLTSDLAARATTQQLNDALVGKHPLLTSESALAVDILSARGLAVGSFVGIGTPTPQAALDVVGSILGSAGLRVGNLDVVERLLEHTASLATISSSLTDVANGLDSKQAVLSEEAPLPASHVDGLLPSLNRLDSALGNKHPLITTETPLSPSLVEGLQEALNTAAASAQIADGSLTIAKTQAFRMSLTPGLRPQRSTTTWHTRKI